MTVRGAPGDDVGFWRFGFIQLGFINEDWAHYCNDNPAEGSVFVAGIDRLPSTSSFAATPSPRSNLQGPSRGFLTWARSSFMTRRHR